MTRKSKEAFICRERRIKVMMSFILIRMDVMPGKNVQKPRTIMESLTQENYSVNNLDSTD
jgi:hypothetical protein